MSKERCVLEDVNGDLVGGEQPLGLTSVIFRCCGNRRRCFAEVSFCFVPYSNGSERKESLGAERGLFLTRLNWDELKERKSWKKDKEGWLLDGRVE